MSKHFDLMQQMEQEQRFGSRQLEEVEFRPQRLERKDQGQPRWANDEALRLVQQIFLRQTQEPPRVVVFAGIDHGNGCSQICASVAETLSRDTGRSVCLLEANFRSPSLPSLMRTGNHRGLTDALIGNEPISSFTQLVTENKLWLLPSGQLAGDSPSLLTSNRLGERLSELRGIFDFVIIDAAPLNHYSDAVALGQLADGLVLIVEADATRREAAAVVAANLRSVKIPILAAVLNKRTYPIPQKIYNKL
jgi:Mrp family chromosome partitioning ATPase